MNIAVLVDIGVVLVLLLSAGVSFFRGFIREVLTVFGVFGGAMIAFLFGGDLKPTMHHLFGIKEGKDPGKLFDVIPMTLAADITAYAAIFLTVFIVLQLLSHFLSATLRAMGLGTVDRTLGIFFGLARGVLLLGVLYLPFSFILPDDSKKEWFEKSKTMFFVQETSSWLSGFLPQDQHDTDKDKAKDALSSTREKLKEIDVLGDKRITPDTPKQTDGKPAESGYDAKERSGLEHLLNTPTLPNPTTKKGAYNE